MTRNNIASETAARVTRQHMNLTAQDARVILDTMLSVVMEAVANGEYVELRGFGGFSPVERAAKKTRNFQQGTTMIVPGHVKPVFTPYGAFTELVKEKRRKRN